MGWGGGCRLYRGPELQSGTLLVPEGPASDRGGVHSAPSLWWVRSSPCTKGSSEEETHCVSQCAGRSPQLPVLLLCPEPGPAERVLSLGFGSAGHCWACRPRGRQQQSTPGGLFPVRARAVTFLNVPEPWTYRCPEAPRGGVSHHGYLCSMVGRQRGSGTRTEAGGGRALDTLSAART